MKTLCLYFSVLYVMLDTPLDYQIQVVFVMLIVLFNAWRTFIHFVQNCIILSFILYSRCSLNVTQAEELSYNLQKLFCQMLLSTNSYINPEEFVQSLEIDTKAEGNAFQFFLTLLSKLQNESVDNPSISSLLQLFTGLQLQTKCCHTCHRVFFIPEPFYFLVFFYYSFFISRNVKLPKIAVLKIFYKVYFHVNLMNRVFSFSVLRISFLSCLLFLYRCQKDVNYESLLSIKELPAILPISIQRNTPGIHIQLPQSFNFTKFSTIVLSSYCSFLSLGSHYSCFRICFVKCYLLS